jgi:MFS transporter, DHA2 family, multidrug resistance protein
MGAITIAGMGVSTPLPIERRKLLGFGVTLLGTFGTTLGGQLVAAGLTDIQGGLGISADEASWISTVYPMAQMAMVPLAAPLALALGIRRLLVMLTFLFLFSCVLAATTTTLEGEIVLRALQGIAAGGYGTAAFAMTFRTFGGRDLGPGLLGLAFATTFPIALGILSTSWLVNHWGWPALYELDALIAAVTLVGVYLFMDTECFQATPLRRLDWLGFGLLAPGLALMFLVLSQGDRRFWTESEWLGWCLLASVSLLAAFVAVETRRTNPLVNLRMLLHPSFGLACLVNFLFRLAMLSPTVLVPRFLSDIQSYRNEEEVAVFWLPSLVQLTLYPLMLWMAHRINPKILVCVGFAFLGVSGLIDTVQTSTSAAPEFLVTQALAGLSPPLIIVPLLLLALRRIRPEDGASAGVLWNIAITLGSTGGAGLLASVIRMRTYQHSNVLNDFLSSGWAPTADRLDGLSANLQAHLTDDAGAQVAAVNSLAGATHIQAVVLALSDAAAILAVLAALGLLATILFPRWQRPLS